MRVTIRDITGIEYVVGGITNSNYTVGDFYIHGGEIPKGEFVIDDRIVKAIDIVTKFYFQDKLRITSTFRTDAYAKSKNLSSKSGKSWHSSGKAVDFVFAKIGYKEQYIKEIRSKGELYKRLVAIGIGEFELHPTHFHLAIESPPQILDLMDKVAGADGGELAIQAVKNTESIPPVKDYYEYYHQDSSIKTVRALFDEPLSIVSKSSISAKDFLNFKGLGGKANWKRMWELYDYDQKVKHCKTYSSLTVEQQRSMDFNPDIEAADFEINVGTLLYIPKNKTSIETLAAIGKDLFMKQQDLTAFMADELRTLINDPTYIPTAKVFSSGSSYSANYLNVSFNCWIYVRALDKILNVTPFIKSLSTSVSQGGEFDFSLNDIADINTVYKYSETWYSYVQKTTQDIYNLSFFQKVIQQNDIVFIRFERLDIEGDDDKRDNDLFVDKVSIPNKIYDMIGLVDTSSETYGSDANISVLNVSGRDFTKVIVEDSCNFFPFALQNGSDRFFLNYNTQDTVFKRLFVSGEYMNLFTMLFRSVRDSLGFIFNQLTNVGVLPKDSNLFDAYKDSYDRTLRKNTDRQSKSLNVNGASEDYLKAVEQNGIWKIIKVIVDNQIDDRRLNNGELSSPEGPIVDLVNKICLAPFVEFWGDTYGDQYVFTARQPIYTKEQIQKYFLDNNFITITADKVGEFNINWDKTYYTWYQLLVPEGLYGTGQFIAGTVSPIVYFEEYAQAFGMHKKVVTDSYITVGALNGDQSKSNSNLYRQALANDLKFLIESNSVLPFTRMGTIKIVGGDRRIKKGTWILFEPTQEIFYVDQVSNSVSVIGNVIVRDTTITVSRGMVKKYVIGKSEKTINGKNINYFDIVNMQVILDSLQVKLDGGEVKVSDSATNTKLIDTDLFDFFLKRKQWD